MFEPIVNYFAGEYVKNYNSDIIDCVDDIIEKDDIKDCKAPPVKTHLTINERIYKKFYNYKKNFENLKDDYNGLIEDLKDMVLISDDRKTFYETLKTNASRKKFLIERIKETPEQLEQMARDYYLLRSQTFKGPRMNGGIFRSPDDKHLLGLMIIPYKVDYDKHNYPKLNMTTEKTGFINKQNTTGDYNYGIGIIGKDFSLDVENFIKTEFGNIEENKHYFPLEDTEASKESFINIPKKSNGLMYVILFILAVFLFRKFKK